MAKENKQEHKRNNIYLDLSFIGILLFLFFRIPLTNIIGNEGNGYFAVTWELYSTCGLLFGLGFSYVTSEMIRKRFQKKQYQKSIKVLTTSLLLGFLISVLGAAILYALSDYILTLISMKLSGISFRLLVVLLITGTIAGIFQGFFEGCGTQVPTCFSKIVGSIVAGTGAIIFSLVLYKYGSKVGALLFNPQYEPAYGATGIVAGCICGSIFSLFFLLVVYRIYKTSLNQWIKKEENNQKESFKALFFEMATLFIFTFIELVFFNLFRVVNMWLYIKNTLETDGKGKIIQYLGSYHGKVLILTSVAILLVLTFTGRNSRRVQRLYLKNDHNSCWKYFCEDVKQILFLSLPLVIVFALLAKQIFMLFYKTAGNVEVTMLQIGSINILLIPIAVYIYRLLRKMNLRLILMVIPFIAFILQSFLMSVIIKLPAPGTLSLIIAEVAFWAFIVVLELLAAMKTLKHGYKSKI